MFLTHGGRGGSAWAEKIYIPRTVLSAARMPSAYKFEDSYEESAGTGMHIMYQV